MIERIYLKNWRTHEETDIRFSKGVNLLLGAMGTGKTSVMDAISFALFGTFPDMQSKKLKMDDVIMNKPIEKNDAEIVLEFSFNNNRYQVKRTIRRGYGTIKAELRENGKLIEAPNPSRVTETIQKILKLDYDTFYNIIYSDQNKIDLFLTLPRGQRKEKIDKVIGINKLENARKSCVTVRSRLSAKIQEKRIFVRELESEKLDEKKKAIEMELSGIDNEIFILNEEVRKIDAELKKVTSRMSELSEYKERMINVEKELNRLRSLYDQIDSDIKRLKPMVSQINEFSLNDKLKIIEDSLVKLKSLISSKKDLLKGKSSEKSSMEMEYNFIKKNLEEKQKRLEEIEMKERELSTLLSEYGKNYKEKMKEIENEISSIVEKIAMNSSLINIESDNINKLINSKGRCPVCNSELPEERKKYLIEEKQRKINEIKKESEELKMRKNNLESMLTKLKEVDRMIEIINNSILDKQKILVDIEEMNRKLDQLPSSISKLDSEISYIEKEIKDLEEDYNRKIEEKTQVQSLLNRVKELKEKEEKLNEISMNIAKYFEEYKTLSSLFDENEFKLLENRQIELIRKESSIKERLQGLNKLKIEKQKRLEEIEKKINLLEKYKKEIQKIERVLKDLEIFEKVLKETQQIVRQEFLEALNYFMEKVFKVLYPYRDYLGLRLFATEDDYILQLKDSRGIWINVDGFASGGERTIAALALRISMARALVPHLRWLILDEPTHNLDERGVEELANLLNEKVTEFIDQLFIITHDQKLENVINGIVYRFERDKTLDTPTKVFQVI